jgi:hypothetical protein
VVPEEMVRSGRIEACLQTLVPKTILQYSAPGLPGSISPGAKWSTL